MIQYKLPFLNPIQYHQDQVGDFFYNNILSFEQRMGYKQIYYVGDMTQTQILCSGSSPTIKIEIITNSGTVLKTYGATDSGKMYGTWRMYYWDNYFNVAAGIRFLKVTLNDAEGVKIFYSEPINLVASQENTVSLLYTHDLNEFDTIFVDSLGSTYATYFIRLEGGMKSDGFAPGGKFTMFQDLDYQSVILQSQPFNVEKFTFGPSEGMPNYMADKINRIFGLSTVKINGVQYSRNEGAKVERTGDTDYPLAGWSIDLIKTENPYSEVFNQNSAAYFLASTEEIIASTELLRASNNLR